MRIWIDLANSPHVPFFRVLADRFIAKHHNISVTARDFAETVELAEAAGFAPHVIGGHGGGKLSGKAGNLVQRALALAQWARPQHFDFALSHNSYSQILAARTLGVRSVTLMDYEHQPANHLAFRFANRIIVPEAFPEDALRRYGANHSKVKRYDGIKEDVYLSDFKPSPHFEKVLSDLGVQGSDVLVTVRPPAGEALYHRFENQLFDQLLNWLLEQPKVKVILLPRSKGQRATYGALNKVIIPDHPLDGSNLVAFSDLVISAGGTMNREAAALGTPAASIYAGAWASIDEELVNQGRLIRIRDMKDVLSLPIRKKAERDLRAGTQVADQVCDSILAP